MIHPLKAATSFDCDGCGHHASFHRMQNPEDEEIARRWKQEEATRERQGTRVVERERFEEVLTDFGPGKRRRIEAPPEFLNLLDEEEEEAIVPRKAGAKGRKRKERE
jgi:hypothetical protein